MDQMVPFFLQVQLSIMKWAVLFIYKKMAVQFLVVKYLLCFVSEEYWSERYCQIWLAEKEQTT